MTILGIDPGTATTGFGVIKYSSKKKGKKKFRFLECGVINTDPNLPPEKRLRKLYLEILRLIKKWQPKIIAIENVYFFKNLKTAMPISQAKGVILLAAAQKKIPVREITPLQLKTTIAGYGRAEKKQIQRMVKVLLDLKEIPKIDDAADALGIAISCSLVWGKNP